MQTKFPKTPGASIDLLYKMREKRLAAQQEIEKLEMQESLLKKHILETLEAQGLEKGSGKVATAAKTTRVVAQVQDWDKFFEYVRKKNAFHLLQRRVSDVAYREVLEHGETVPGAEPFTVVSLSLTKR